ncbi:MAG: peptidase M14 [Chryseobacterium sp.]|nr:peptidase M14 [Chryseobacterium sp.]
MEKYYTRNPNFPNRYISPAILEKYLQNNLSDYLSQIGTSSLGKPVYMLSLGKGKTKVMAWSQMHGNESNGTHALLDLLETFSAHSDLKENIFQNISLDFIVMLNPDGAEKWTRRNALEIDLNRDFYQQASQEFKILKRIFDQGDYQYGLNLHEQRTIFTTDGEHPATLSFLAPSENAERTLTATRKKAMAVISQIYRKMKPLLPNGIGRYTDEFYPTSVGDNFTRLKMATILFEGGHFPEDYKRERTRKFYTLALYHALDAISTLKGAADDYKLYFEIPENKETHYDIIYRNVRLNTDFECVLDIAVQYQEVLKNGKDEISFVPIVKEVGDCGKKKGWKEIDCTGKQFISKKTYPKLDAAVDFKII